MIYLDSTKKVLSESQEDYLKQIFLLTESQPTAGTQDLSEKLGVNPASVTVMIQKLKELDLVIYEHYKGVSLTEKGRIIALEILRHHRLLESFLYKALGYSWDEVHDEAERLEHYISETFESRIAKWLGNPSRDPHGDPIPDEDLNLPNDSETGKITDQMPGYSGQVIRVFTHDRDELNLFAALGMVPGARLVLLEIGAENIRIQAGEKPYLLPLTLGAKLWVRKDTE